MNIDVKKVKIIVTVPANNIDDVRNAICSEGAGVIGNYTYCTTSTKCIGTFIPSQNAKPYIGEQNKLEFVEEEKLGVIHISTGSLIREDAEMYEKYKEELERGQLLSDEVISEILKRKLQRDCINKTCIIDGYPRTIRQAHILDRMLTEIDEKIEKVFLLETDIDTIYSRILSRTVCSSCGKIYNEKYAKENGNKCGKCGKELTLRLDDNVATLKNRINLYYENIDEIKEYYSAKNILEVVDAIEDPNKIVERVK
jgi:adenylate kinase